jgi:hypothetical protein
MRTPKSDKGDYLSVSHKTAASQEKSVADKFGIQQTYSSGRYGKKGDSGQSHRDLVRLDNKGTIHKSYSIKLSDIEALSKDCIGYGQIPVFELSFKDSKGNVLRSVCIIDTDELANLVRENNDYKRAID